MIRNILKIEGVVTMESKLIQNPYLKLKVLNIRRILAAIKGNFWLTLQLTFVCWCFYQYHLDGVRHASDKYISFSEAWENIHSGKYMRIQTDACERALELIKN